MSDRGRYQVDEPLLQETAEKPSASNHRPRSGLVVAALLLGVVVLLLRIFTARDGLLDRAANPSLLKAAMRTVADPSATVNAPDNLFADGAPSGLSARAMSAIALASGQPASAERWLTYGLTDPSSAYLSQFELCLLYWNEGQRAKAREVCRGTQASIRYWLSRGYHFEDLRQLEEALAYYDIAAAIDPDSAQAWYVMGRTLFGLDRYDEAITAYERMMVLDPTPPVDVYEALGRAYLKMDNLQLARDVLNRGLMVFPNQRTFFLAMADTYRAESDYRAADSWYARMLQRWPDDVQAWSGRGDMAVANDQLSDAVRYYQKAVEFRPLGFEYWLNLAKTARAGGDAVLADEAYREALMLQPDNPAVLLQVGQFYAETKRTAEAREIFERVLQLQPGNREATDQLVAIGEPSKPPNEQ